MNTESNINQNYCFYSTGKRKTSIAKVWVQKGTGIITINNKRHTKYFLKKYVNIIKESLIKTKTEKELDIYCNVKGGGISSQSSAVLHGISKTLSLISKDNRSILNKNKFLTRDPRVVERKKYGKRKARKRVQFSKR